MSRLIDRVRASRALPVPADPLYGYMQQTYTKDGLESVLPTFQSYAAEGYQGNGVVFSLILARISLGSECEFKFQDKTTKRIFGSPALSLLENPWPSGTTGELLARMIQDADLAGNAFVRRVSADRLERLRPDWVDIASEEDPATGANEVIGYVYWRGGRQHNEPEVYLVHEVAHWSPIPDPLAEWRGMSWLTPVVREINADASMTQHKSKFFENAATPNLVIRYATKLAPEQVVTLRDRWQARFGGPDNGWKTAILDEGADLTVVGNSFEQMSFTAVQAAGENRVAAAAGVPGIVVGFKEGLAAATYSNYEQAMRRFADVTMRPLWRSAAAALAKLVDVPVGARLWYDVGGIAALRQGEKDRAETAQIYAAAAMNLINAGYVPDSVTAALTSGDMTQLTHTGAIPTALYPEGRVPITGGKPA